MVDIEISPRIARLRDDLRAFGADALEDFWREATAAGTPMVEPLEDGRVLVTFLWRGTAESTCVTWGIDAVLVRLDETDLWYGSLSLPADLCTLYCFRHDGTEDIPTDTSGHGLSHVDEHNPHPLLFPGDPDFPDDCDQWMSVLQLPAAPPEPWTATRAGVPRGRLAHEWLDSVELGDRRRVSVYQPAGVPTDGLPALVVFDGYLSRTVMRIPSTLDNLIAAGLIPPLVALFVSSPSGDRRNLELTPNDSIVDFVTGELLPWAKRGWNISDRPQDRVIAGVSRGGLVALHVALRAPDDFGAVIAQSGSFWWPSPDEGEPGWLIREVTKRPQTALRIYLDVGNQEDMPGPNGAPPQLRVNRAMRDALQERGYPVTYAEYTGGHDYVNWRRTFADGLLAVLGPREQEVTNTGS